MNIDKDIRDELIELMMKSINHYNSFKRYEWVVKPAIPILFFGNIIEYLNSDIKIITEFRYSIILPKNKIGIAGLTTHS